MVRSLPVIPIRDAVHFPRLINTLLVIREPSIKAAAESSKTERRVLILSQRDMSIEEPEPSDLFEVGIVSEVLQTTPLPDGKLRLVLRGLYRARAKKIVCKKGTFFSEYEQLVEEASEGVNVDALSRTAVQAFMGVVEKNTQIPPESIESVVHAEGAGLLADTIAHHLPLKSADKQTLLQETRAFVRLEETVRFLKVEEEILAAKVRIEESVDRQLGEAQRDYLLREQLRHIQKELNERDGSGSDLEEYRARIMGAEMPESVKEKANAELRRLEIASTASPEALVIRNYLETLVELPWEKRSEEMIDVHAAKRLLDERHFGLDQVKERILDFLAVHQLGGRSVGSILCFAGPPGVGKTSIGKSIADAMGRKFVRIALGGVRDEAEIRGHRRTYIGSMPGRIMQGLRTCGTRNPVILLDEIDKLGQGVNGDPMSALLEALDPEQNRRFSDHYVEIPFDLGDVIFVATANTLDTVPTPIRDRMEVLQFSAYTDEEKFEIAKQFLVPRQREYCGLKVEQLGFKDGALLSIVRDYTREAGVRDLERQVANVCRKAARAIAEGTREEVCVTPEGLRDVLGASRARRGSDRREGQPGLAWGLVVSEAGGDVIPIEAMLLPRRREGIDIKLTGSLGDVMKESALAALTFLQSRDTSPFDRDVHIHVPEGGIPKEGPSAGLATLFALASAKSNCALAPGFATTGEITLLGRVLPVGGVRDKVLAAIRAEFTDVILPADNEADLDTLPANVRSRISIHFVKTAAEGLDLVLPR